MALYDSILLRQNLQDQGIMPRTGGWTASPDIIMAGTEPIQQPTQVFTSAESYATDPTQPVVQNATNYVYVRGKNLSATAQAGEARVFAARQSLFLYPQQWLQNPLKTTAGLDTTPIAQLDENQIGVTKDPLVWIAGDISEHHCLVGFISTDSHPFDSQKPPNAVTSLNDLAAWIGKTGGSGWHNVQFTTAGAPTFTNTTNYPGSSTPGKIQFAITCNECPVGSEVSFSCGTPLPDGTYINLPRTRIETTGQIGFFVDYEIPAGWTSPIMYSYYDNGLPPAGENWGVSMSASIKSDTESTLEFAQYTRPRAEVFPNHFAVGADGRVRTDMGDMPVSRLIPVGSDLTKLPEPV